MTNGIKTHEANINLVEKFLDYANCADAAYALLEYIKKNAEYENEDKADNLTFGNKLEQDIQIKDNNGELLYTKPKGTNTAYACAIQARFQKDKIINQSLCFPYTNTCLNNETINNDITKIKLDDKLSQRTINFVNRFKVLYHQSNTDSGFSATLFEDTQDSNQKILAIRGTEISNDIKNDALDADMVLITGKVPNNQYIDMLLFYQSCIKQGYITQSTPLIITGHSLGGYLAQRFCPIICYNQ